MKVTVKHNHTKEEATERAKKFSTKQIAEAVHLGTNTILWYRKRLYAKLDVHSAAAFTAEILKKGLLD